MKCVTSVCPNNPYHWSGSYKVPSIVLGFMFTNSIPLTTLLRPGVVFRFVHRHSNSPSRPHTPTIGLRFLYSVNLGKSSGWPSSLECEPRDVCPPPDKPFRSQCVICYDPFPNHDISQPSRWWKVSHLRFPSTDEVQELLVNPQWTWIRNTSLIFQITEMWGILLLHMTYLTHTARICYYSNVL